MKSYFAYIRVSTVKQGERGSSLAEQRDAIRNYAAQHSLHIVRWFEETETAAKQGRRLFSEMLRAFQAGQADGLVVHKIDRSARNLRDWAELGDLIDRRVDVRFVTDNLDLLSRGGRLSADIQAVVAADYIRNLREEVKKGLYGRLKQGLYPFAAPLGYRNNGKAAPKTIDPRLGPLVREMFGLYASNTTSLMALRHQMWAKGLRTGSGNPLPKNSVSDILNNPFYAGIIKLGSTGEVFPGVHEPLISVAQFNRVQAILRGKTVPKGRNHRFFLRQLVRCGNCGRRTLTGELQKGRVYYRCHICKGVCWAGSELDRIILLNIRDIRLDARDFGDLKQIVAEQLKGQSQRQAERAAADRLRMGQLDSCLQRLTALLIDGTIDPPTFKTEKERLVLERQALSQDGAVDPVPEIEDLFETFERSNSKLLRYEMLEDEEKRELLQIICSNFSVRGENVAFELQSPYRDLAKQEKTSKCGHRRDNVRTKARILMSHLESAARSVAPHTTASDAHWG